MVDSTLFLFAAVVIMGTSDGFFWSSLPIVSNSIFGLKNSVSHLCRQAFLSDIKLLQMPCLPKSKLIRDRLPYEHVCMCSTYLSLLQCRAGSMEC